MTNLGVTPGYSVCSIEGNVTGFIFDLRDAIEEAHAARDDDGKEAIRRIVYDHFQKELLSKTAEDSGAGGNADCDRNLLPISSGRHRNLVGTRYPSAG
jgi:hypothetical protein